MASPAIAQEPKFDVFLNDFRHLYTVYHMGPRLPQTDVDRIAVRIWTGSGGGWTYASTTACQSICESHLELNTKPSLKYRGHVGMHLNTIVAEGVRIGVIKHRRSDIRWLLSTCRKDPSYADFLSASRLVFLIHHYGTVRIAIFQYVKGNAWKTNKRKLHDAQAYWNTVRRLQIENFSEGL